MHRPSLSTRWATLSILLACFLLTVNKTHAHPESQDGIFGRPTLVDAQTYGTEHFLIHYTTSDQTSNAVNPEDLDGSGIPDYVELVGQTLEEVYQIQIEGFGWSVPPSDGNFGGDERIDVYLQDILSFGIAGFVSDADGFIRDNPNSEEVERNAAFSFMSLDNDYAEAADPNLGYENTPTELMQATAAHEFNHILQLGYDSIDIHSWLYEATATWIEDEIYDDVNDGIYYLDEVFYSPDTCLVAAGSELGYGLRWYGSWLFMRHLSEQFGSEIVQEIWAQSRQLNGFEAIDAALEPFDTSLEQETFNYATQNLLKTYEEGDSYLPVLLEAQARAGETFRPDTGVQSLGVDYIQLPSDGLVSIELLAAADMSLRLVGINDGTDFTIVDARDDRLVTNLSLYDESYLIVHNNQRVVDEADCANTPYEIDIRQTQDGPTPPSTTGVAEFYVEPVEVPILGDGPPPFTGATQGDSFIADQPEELVTQFDPVIPSNAPPGYAFDYGYLAEPNDFGEDQQYYLPSAEQGVSYDYVDGEGNWIGIIQSPTPYEDLSEYLDERDLNPDQEELAELISVQEYDVLIEDISNEATPYFSGTIILGELFIVVDGDDNFEDVEAMLNNLITTFEGGVGGVNPATNNQPLPPPLPQPSTQLNTEPFNPDSGLPPRAALISMATLGVGILSTGFCVAFGFLIVVIVLTSRLTVQPNRMPQEISESMHKGKSQRGQQIGENEEPDNRVQTEG